MSGHSLQMMNLFIKSWNWQLAKKYIVRLTEAERTNLESLIHKGKVAAHKRLHAEILLKADITELGEKWLDS
jgi:hypothetical protein